MVGRKPERFEVVIAQIKKSGVERDPLVILADIAADFERIIKETIGKYGRLDVLINNAAFSIPGAFGSVKPEHFDSVSNKKQFINRCLVNRNNVIQTNFIRLWAQMFVVLFFLLSLQFHI